MTILNPAKKVKRNEPASNARISPPRPEYEAKRTVSPCPRFLLGPIRKEREGVQRAGYPVKLPFSGRLVNIRLGTGPRRLPGPVGRSKNPNPVLLAAHRTESGTGIKVAFYGREGRVWEKTQKRGRALERSRPLAGDDFYLAFFSSSSSFFRSADLFLRSWNLSRFLSASAL